MAYSILVVDDDEPIRDSVEEYLTILNYNVKSAENADKALETLKTFYADIVITDIMMQGINGLELTKTIKEKYDSDVMVMTGYSAEYSYEEAVNAGASDFIFKPFRFEELDLRITRVLKEAEAKKERTKLLKKLEKLAITDALTKLYNSRHFFSEIKAEIDRHSRYSHPLSMLLLDIDFFKNYNDTWGHLEGDKVLMAMGVTIKSCMRSMDTAYRYGGEEFAVLLPETEIEEACLVGMRIKKAVSAHILEPEPGKHQSVNVSIGATELIIGDTSKDLIKRSDKALYQAKETGRNKLCRL